MFKTFTFLNLERDADLDCSRVVMLYRLKKGAELDVASVVTPILHLVVVSKMLFTLTLHRE